MYYAHFGLKEPPFKITPNTEFFFNGNNRGAVLDALIYAITSGEGIVKVVGEVGSGKTMLCRMLQTLLPAHVECIYLANPSVAPEDILHAIAFELGLKLPKNADKLKVMQALQAYLLERHEQGKRVVIFVEEAQGMPLATLEEIRLLSNLETKHDKLLQMVLFGQPELDDNLNQTHIRQLRERITHSFNLTPLHPKEVGEYLIFRLRAAGYFGPHLFSEKAIAMIANSAEGLVRRVNILGDKSLLAAFADNVYQVTPKHVKAAIADSEFGAEKAKKSAKKYWFVGLAAMLVLIPALSFLAYHFYQPAMFKQILTNFNIGNVRKTSAKPLPKLPAKVVIKPLVKAPAPQATEQAILPAQTPVQTAVEATPSPVNTNAGVTAPTSITAPNQSAAPSQTSPLAPNVNASPQTSSPAPVVAPPASATVTPASVNVSSAPTIVAPETDILSERIAATKQWMSVSAQDTVTIQVLSTADEAQLKNQLASLVQIMEFDNLYVYVTQRNAQPFYTMVYGAFVDRFSANVALKKLPASLRKNHPHLRTIGGILEETNKNI